MPKSRLFPRAAWCAVALAMFLPATAAKAEDQAQALAEAIQSFEDGAYLAAQEALAGIDRTELTSEQQRQRDDYLNRVQVALTMSEKALRDLEDAETAMADRAYDRADALLSGVVSNEYAPQPVRRAALAHRRDVRERAKLIRESTPADEPIPDAQAGATDVPVATPLEQPGDMERARQLTREADGLVRSGEYDQATGRYQAALQSVPGYPEAVDGLDRVRQHEALESGAIGQSLAERIRRQDAINWQRTTALYRDVERRIREHVTHERLDEAGELLARARQIVESGKQFADPITKFENLRSELEALTNYVRTEERAYHERKVSEARREIEEQRSERLRQVEEKRARQVEALMQQALQLRKDGELAKAINVLKQVVVIDPRHAPARWLMDILEDQRHFREGRENRNEFYGQSRAALEEVERAKIPWHELLTYPKDWLEIISREERRLPGEARRDSRLLGMLDHRVPVDFRGVPFDQVMERLADAHQLNIIVNWHDLGRAGVERSIPIELDLPREITLKKVITEVLEQAGGGLVDIGYEVADGAVTIATQQFLDKKTYPAVYNITDLLMEVPQFSNAPVLDLFEATHRVPRRSERSDLPWRVGDDDDDEPEEDRERLSRVRKIMELIRDTVNPDSWRDRGGSIGVMNELNGQLVVTQNSAAHRRISGLLDKLREERAIQVAVEALFITVSSNYLEEMGLDLDIVLNGGTAGFDFINSGQGPVVDPVLGNRLLLPRTFSRLGFVPNTPTLGTALGTPAAGPLQPFTQPFLVPQRTGGGGSLGTPVPITSSLLDFTNPASLTSDVPGSFAGQTIGPALQIFGSFLDNIQVDFLLRATQVDSRSSILTAPRVVVFNGGSAWVAVTIQQNFVSQLTPIVAQGAVAQQPVTQTIDAGASLFVRATVTADKRYVMMLLAPGVTRLLALQTFQFSGGTGAFPAFIQLPTLSVQRVQTVVSVPDGGTLLLGGQKISSETEVEAGVPILSKIPILRRVYSSRSMVKDEQTLLILVKPKILIHTEQEELAFPSFKQG